MRRNFRVIQINGFRGLFLALFAFSCLIAGFVAFPSFLIMNAWNYLSSATGSFPVINFGESLLLLAIIVLSVFIFGKKKFIVSFNSPQELSEDEVRDVVAKIKAQKGLNESKELCTKKACSCDEKSAKSENSEHTAEVAAVQGVNKEN